MYSLWLFASLTAVFALWTGLGLGGDDAALYFDDLATIAAAAIATIACMRVARRREGRPRLFWSLLAAGCAAWSLGETLWAYYDLVVGEVPAASWADAAYLAALPLVAAALLVHPALRGRAGGRLRLVVDGLVLAAALFLLAWTLVLEPVRRDIDISSLGGLVTIAYPLSDVVIILLVVLVIRGTTIGDRRDLWCLLAGLLLIAFSDSIYTYLTNVRGYTSGNMIDTGWFAGYLAIALAALSARKTPEPPAAAPALSPTAIIAPFLPMLAALLYSATRIQLGHHLDNVTLVAAFTLVGLVLARQTLLVITILTRHSQTTGTVSDRLVAALGNTTPDHDTRSTLRLR